MVQADTFAATLRQYAPIAQLINEPDELRKYDVDGFLPRLVVIPDAVEQVAQIVVLTNQQGLKLLTRGGGSRISLGGIPEQVDILLETTKLTRLLEHEAPDLTCHVEAGITLAALHALFATTGQCFALHPPHSAQIPVCAI